MSRATKIAVGIFAGALLAGAAIFVAVFLPIPKKAAAQQCYLVDEQGCYLPDGVTCSDNPSKASSYYSTSCVLSSPQSCSNYTTNTCSLSIITNCTPVAASVCGLSTTGSISIGSVTPSPADTSITVSGVVVGGSDTQKPNCVGSPYVYYITAIAASPTGWTISSSSLTGSYTLTTTATGSDGFKQCPPSNFIFDYGGDNQYSFSFPADVGNLPDGNYTITVNADTIAPISASAPFTVTHPKGTIQVNSVNSVTKTSVAASWYFPGFPTGADPCQGSVANCSGTSVIYPNQRTGLYTIDAPYPNQPTPPGYAFGGIRLVQKTASPVRSLLGMLKNWLGQIAYAQPVIPSPSQNVNTNQTTTFEIDWVPEATLSVSPTTLNLVAQSGGPNPTGSVQISNTGTAGSTLDWSTSVSQPWLSATPAAGNGIAASGSQNSIITADISTLAPGNYTGTVTVNAISRPSGKDPATGSPQQVTVNLTVNPLSAPNLISATPSCAVSTSKISLAWGGVTGATGYKVYRGGVLYQDVGNVTSWDDTAVTAGTNYTYTVVAYNTVGQSSQSNPQSATAPNCIGTITVNWTKDGVLQGPSTFSVQYQIANTTTGTTPVPNPAPGTYVVNTTHPNVPVGDYVFAHIAGVPSGTGAAASFITPSPNQTLMGGGNITFTMNFVTILPGPFSLSTSVSCSPANTPQVTLTWTNSSNATSYNVWRNGSLLISNVTSPYADSNGLSPATTYKYKIEAVNAGGSTFSDGNFEKSATTNYCLGDITVNATLDGAAWTGPQSMNYQIFGPAGSTITGTAVVPPRTHQDQVPGLWTFSYTSGGPPGVGANPSILMNGSPGSTGLLSNNVNPKSTLTFTVAFVSNRSLTVSKTGTGSGSVTSSPAGINCGTTCSATYSNGTSITLTATPNAGSTFVGWSGGGCTGTGTCTLTMNADVTVTAQFDAVIPSAPTLNVPTTSCSGSTSQVALSWNSVANATGYKVYRNNTLLQDVGNVLSFTDGTVASGTTYTYEVTAYSAGGESPRSNQQIKTAIYCTGDIIVSATLNGSPWPAAGTGTMNYQITGPGPLINGSTVPSTHTSQLTGLWQASWSSGGPAGAALIGISPASTQNLPSDQTTKPTITFTFQFISIPATADIKANGSDGPVTITYNTSATISWTSTNATSCSVAPTGWTGTSNPGITTGNLTSSQTYTLTCTGPGGQGTDSVTVNLAPPGAFTLNPPTASCNASTSQVSLSWTSSSGAVSYTVNRTGGVAFTPVNVGLATSYIDSTVSPGVTYAYTITASNPAGNTNSNSQQVIPTWCVGDITVAATLNSAPYSGPMTYNLFGATTVGSNTVPTTHANLQNGSWILSVTSGIPGATQTGILPSNQQVIPSDQTTKPTLTFTVQFLSNYVLVVQKTGTNGGSGTVTSSDGKINCGGSCSGIYLNGNTVDLTAAPAADSSFVKWIGGGACDQSTNPACTLTMNSDVTITAEFKLDPPRSFTLSPPVASCEGPDPRISLSWTAAVGATSYTVFRNGSSYAQVSSATDFVDTVASSGTNYTYYVQATNAAGNTNSNSQQVTATYCVGDITVNATFNGSSWNGAVSYDLLGPALISGTSVATTHPNLESGTWLLSYNSGGPSGGALQTITPSPVLTLSGNQTSKPTLTFTMNFVTYVAPPPPDFQLSASPGSRTINQGGSTTFTITATCQNGFAGPVTNLQVSNLQTNATASFNPTSLNCGGNTTLSIWTNASTQTGTNSLTISGDGSGVGTRSTNVSLTVNTRSLSSCPGNQPRDNFEVCVYNGTNFNTYVNSFFENPPLSHNYGSGGPLSLTDNYSVRWLGQFYFNAGTYQFTTVANDGVRLAISGSTIINRWSNVASGTTLTNNATYTFNSSGYYNVFLRYYDSTGTAFVSLDWLQLPNAPTAVSADNSTCGQITVNWNDTSTNEAGFYVWRNPSVGGTTKSYGGRTYSRIATPAANVTSYTDSPPTGSSYYYLVTSYITGYESAVHNSWPLGPTFNNTCNANLSGSLQIVSHVNGQPYTNQVIKNGDTVTFQIIIDNRTPPATQPAYDVYIDNTLTDNLQYIPDSASLTRPPLSYWSPVNENINGQTITWDDNQNFGDKPASNQNWILQFDAKVNSSSLQAVDFFQSSGVINYARVNGGNQNQKVSVQTNLTPIKLGQTQVPNIIEVPPGP